MAFARTPGWTLRLSTTQYAPSAGRSLQLHSGDHRNFDPVIRCWFAMLNSFFYLLVSVLGVLDAPSQCFMTWRQNFLFVAAWAALMPLKCFKPLLLPVITAITPKSR